MGFKCGPIGNEGVFPLRAFYISYFFFGWFLVPFIIKLVTSSDASPILSCPKFPLMSLSHHPVFSYMAFFRI